MLAYRRDKLFEITEDVITPDKIWCDFLIPKQKLQTIGNFTQKMIQNTNYSCLRDKEGILLCVNEY